MTKDHKGPVSAAGKQKKISIRPVMPAENMERGEGMEKKYTKDKDASATRKKNSTQNESRNKENSTNRTGHRQ